MKKTFKKIIIVIVCVVLVVVLGGVVFVKTQMTHHNKYGTPIPIKPSGDKVLDSIRRGVEFLRVHQEPNGEFSAGLLDPKPAFTALVADALLSSPDGYHAKMPFVSRALDAIVSHQQEDGGIYTPSIGLANYCTSIAVMALSRTGDQYSKVIEKAQHFLTTIQNKDGGYSYSTGGDSDLSNTVMAVEAIKKSGLSEEDEAYKKAIAFVTRCQNNSETNTEVWAGDDGGFIYRPENSKAGTKKLPDGKVEYVSYGLMSYAGLVSFLWAGVDKNDPRVTSAFKWVQANWTLEENRNLGKAGLYYYYLTMAKALQAYGQRHITTPDGKKHDWPRELIDTIITMQDREGAWKNSNTKWFEGDKILVTAYMIKTLSICHKVMNEGGE